MRKGFYRLYSRNLFLCLAAVLILTSCKTSKTVVASGEIDAKLSSKQIIKSHSNASVNFKTLQGKVKIELTQGKKTKAHTFNLRIEKDKVIWLNATFGLARMMITPEKVRFYSRLDNTYFDGDYSLLNDFVGFDLDFFKVQNILMGQAIFDLKDRKHRVSTQNNSYVLEPKKQDAFLELIYLMNASHFKLNSLQLAQQIKRRFLQVDYTAYQEVDSEVIPKNIKIIAVEDNNEAQIAMEIKSVSLNGDVRFPFKIPSGFKEIDIK